MTKRKGGRKARSKEEWQEERNASNTGQTSVKGRHFCRRSVLCCCLIGFGCFYQGCLFNLAHVVMHHMLHIHNPHDPSARPPSLLLARCLGFAVAAGVHDSEQGQTQQRAFLPQHQGSHCLPAAGLPQPLQVSRCDSRRSWVRVLPLQERSELLFLHFLVLLDASPGLRVLGVERPFGRGGLVKMKCACIPHCGFQLS